MLLRWFTRPVVPALLAWGALCLIVFYAVNSLIMPWVAGRYTQTTGVPKLVGLKMDQAKEVINDSGLAIVLDTASDFSAEIPAGKIMSQFPDAGTTDGSGSDGKSTGDSTSTGSDDSDGRPTLKRR